jgi:hypothetical protein
VTTWPRFAARYAKQPNQRLEWTGERASCFMRVTVTAGRSTARRWTVSDHDFPESGFGRIFLGTK